MGCGVVERHLEMAQPTKKTNHGKVVYLIGEHYLARFECTCNSVLSINVDCKIGSTHFAARKVSRGKSKDTFD